MRARFRPTGVVKKSAGLGAPILRTSAGYWMSSSRILMDLPVWATRGGVPLSYAGRAAFVSHGEWGRSAGVKRVRHMRTEHELLSGPAFSRPRGRFAYRPSKAESKHRSETKETPIAFVDFFKSNYGPTVAAYRGLADDSIRAAELDEELANLARCHDRGKAKTVMNWEYLMVKCTRRT